MIEYNPILLTDLEDINRAAIIRVQYGTDVCFLRGDLVRSFIKCTNEAIAKHPGEDCLSCGLQQIPESVRFVVEYLYEILCEVIV